MSSLETSNSVILDLVTRFFSKLLENDSNSTYYLNEWSSFHEILSKMPFSVGAAFSHISNLSVPSYAKPILIRPTPITEINPVVRNISFTAAVETELNGSFDGIIRHASHEEKIQQRRRGNSYGGSHEMLWNREEASRSKPSRFAQNTNIFSASTNDSPNQRTFNILTDDLLSGTSVDYGHNALSRETSGGKYPLNFLAEKARRFKDNVENNSDTLLTLQKLNVKSEKYGQYAQYEERSPLRKVKFYEIQEEQRNVINIHKQISDFSSNYMQGLKLY